VGDAPICASSRGGPSIHYLHMRNLTTRLGSVSVALSCLALFAAVATGCGSSSTSTGADGGTPPPDGTDSGTCAPGATGTLGVTISGLPAGVAAKVVVHDAAGDQPVDATRAAASSPSGDYTVKAEIVAGADPIVRTAYVATVSDPSFCLSSGESKTVTVTYAPIGSSNKLWMTNQDSTSGQLAAFASADLGASAAPAAAANVKGPAGRHLAFDKEGNMWTMGPTTVDPQLVRFPAAMLGASGEKTPDRKINVGSTCIPGLSDLAFDATGNLWITSGCGKNVIRLTQADLAADGNVTPAVAITGLDAPDGIAFDSTGNLWVADSNAKRLLRYDVARLGASTSDAASLSIDVQDATTADLPPGSLAFDASGNLWSTSFGGNVIYKLTPAELSGTGTKTLVPSVAMTVQAGALLESIAFDESGGLWLTYSSGKIARIASSQQMTSTNAGSPTIPETIIGSADLAYADGLAFFPAPAALPLYAKLP
jgi:sugar lactone lactonase YvrE